MHLLVCSIDFRLLWSHISLVFFCSILHTKKIKLLLLFLNIFKLLPDCLPSQRRLWVPIFSWNYVLSGVFCQWLPPWPFCCTIDQKKFRILDWNLWNWNKQTLLLSLSLSLIYLCIYLFLLCQVCCDENETLTLSSYCWQQKSERVQGYLKPLLLISPFISFRREDSSHSFFHVAFFYCPLEKFESGRSQIQALSFRY